MIRLMLLSLLLAATASASEPRVCQSQTECTLPDKIISEECSLDDVERCLVVVRIDCGYFVKLHGQIVSGGQWGFRGKPKIYTDKLIDHYTIVGSIGGALQVTIDNVTSEAFEIFGNRSVGGRRIHLSRNRKHYTLARRDGKVWTVNVDGTWHTLPSWTSDVTRIQYGPGFYQVLVEYETKGGSVQSKTFYTRSTPTVEYR